MIYDPANISISLCDGIRIPSLTRSSEHHGSRWVADIPLHVESPTCARMRRVQGDRTRLQVGEVVYDDVFVVLADVTDGVETWRAFYYAAGTEG